MNGPAEEQSGNQKSQGSEAGIKVPLQFIMSTDVLNHFSNYAVVQHDGENDIFILSFYDIQKPPIMGSKEEIEEAQKKIEVEGIPAVCLARIVLNPPHFKRFVAILQKHLEQVESLKKDSQKQS